MRNEPTPAMKRFTKYQKRLRGSAFSDVSKICFRHDLRISSPREPAKVPRVKNTYPLTKFVRSNTIFSKTFTNPNVPDAHSTLGSTRRRFTFSDRNMTNPPA